MIFVRVIGNIAVVPKGAFISHSTHHVGKIGGGLHEFNLQVNLSLYRIFHRYIIYSKEF